MYVRNIMVYIETARRLKSAACRFIKAGRRMSHSLNKNSLNKKKITYVRNRPPSLVATNALWPQLRLNHLVQAFYDMTSNKLQQKLFLLFWHLEYVLRKHNIWKVLRNPLGGKLWKSQMSKWSPSKIANSQKIVNQPYLFTQMSYNNYLHNNVLEIHWNHNIILFNTQK